MEKMESATTSSYQFPHPLSAHSSNRSNSDVESNSKFSARDDESLLAHFGKRQQFKRNLGFMSLLGLGSTLSLTWEGSLVGIHYHLLNGGSASAIAAFPIIAAGVFLQVLVMAELTSMIPLSGGAYNWIAVLSPRRFSNCLSYVTGWTLVLAWQAASASVAWLVSVSVLSLAQMNHPEYDIKVWHMVLAFYAVIGIAVLFTTVLGRVFPGLESAAFLLHVLGFFVILIVVLYLAPKTDPKVVFGTFINGGAFSSNAQAAIVGSVGTMFGFNGVDAAIHMAEEVKNAAVTIPRALITTMIITAVTAWAMLIAIFFCMGPPETVLSTTMSFPYMAILLDITKSKTGATLMITLILVLSLSTCIGSLATASRMLWAFAREDGVPFSNYISRVDSRSALPLYSIAVTALISLLLALLNFGSKTAFQALLSLTVAAFYSSFILAAGIMLYRRLTLPASAIKWGPFRLGKAGVPITALAIVYSVVGFLFSFWPQVAHPTLKEFNWSSVVFGGVSVIATVWWAFHARHTYTGPKMEIEMKC